MALPDLFRRAHGKPSTVGGGLHTARIAGKGSAEKVRITGDATNLASSHDPFDRDTAYYLRHIHVYFAREAHACPIRLDPAHSLLQA